jgi:UDP-4-amino-4,6-dideoxy-N-acetyl-beta-L-altrosamine transaminase
VTEKYIPYSTQSISQEDVDAVISVLHSGWLTGGDTVENFEKAVAKYCGVPYGAAVSNGTAALHACMRALRLQSEDEVIVPAISFIATANAVLYEQATPVFCDVLQDTLLIDPQQIENHITEKTKAVIAVDYAGQLCDYEAIKNICKKANIYLVADCCHSLGASAGDLKSGAFADLSVLSFHPVKQITTGEGGMVLTSSRSFYLDICRFRNHGISHDPAQRHKLNQHSYTIDELGWNYRLTDIQSALGLSQLQKLDFWINRRREIAKRYDKAFSNITSITPLSCDTTTSHAYHLYVVKVPQRDIVFAKMRERGIGVNVHYLPIHLHNLYRKELGTHEGLCPTAEKAYASLLSIPIFPELSDEDQQYIVDNLIEITDAL